MKKVLIITYYWPPAGGSGVQRWLKFAKYLREFGWEPVIYTADTKEFPIIDESLLGEVPEGVRVITRPIWEPFGLYRKLTGQGKVNVGFAGTERQSLMSRMSIWIRGNIFIPDSRRFWIRPSVRYLSRLLREEYFDAIVSTGPPHSMHLIGLGLKQNTGIPWLADFRDPWSNIDYSDKLKLSERAKRIHLRLERSVLEDADLVVGVSQGMVDELKALGAKNTCVITNGFDHDDFREESPSVSNSFVIAHVGVMPPSRNPGTLWSALHDLCEDIDGFRDLLKVRLVGNVDQSIINDIRDSGLQDRLDLVGQVDHAESIRMMRTSAILLLAINRSVNAKNIITGKLFEYMGAGRPVLAVGPEGGEVSDVLQQSGAGVMVDYENKEEMKDILTQWYSEFRKGSLSLPAEGIKRYSRYSLTKDMAVQLDKLCKT